MDGELTMNPKKLLKIITSPVVLLIIALAVVLHQYLIWGIWWEWDEIHHEAFVIALIFAAIISFAIKKRWSWQ